MKSINVEAFEIDATATLDRIHSYWCDLEPGRGYVTITCYGCAWTAYFGAMPGRTIREFFEDADTSYLVTKLGITPTLKQGNRHHAYLSRIIDSVKNSLKLAKELQ